MSAVKKQESNLIEIVRKIQTKDCSIALRSFRAEDLQEILTLFYQTIHYINAKDYTEEQLDVWAPQYPDEQAWLCSLEDHVTIVACHEAKIIGFGDITKMGYLDRLYVHKDFQRWGVGTLLTESLEQYAKEMGQKQVTTAASITARPFFAQRGYQLLKEQQVWRKGIGLTNFLLAKNLT